MKKIFVIAILLVLISGCSSINLKRIEINAGEELSKDVDNYVKKIAGNKDDYKLDLSNVNIDAAGEYTYTVTYKGKTYSNKIIVNGTVPAYVEIQDIHIEQDEKPDLNKAIFYSSIDKSSIEVRSLKPLTDNSFKTVGNYEIEYLINDGNNDNILKKGNIIVYEKGTLEALSKSDTKVVKHDSKERKFKLDTLMNNYYIKFDQAIDANPKDILNITDNELKNYINNKYQEYNKKEYEIIGLYNKYNYLVAVTIKITVSKDDDIHNYFLNGDISL